VEAAVAASLDITDLVAQAFPQPEDHLVVGMAVGGDALSMALDLTRKVLIRLKPLPAQALLPRLELTPAREWLGRGRPIIQPSARAP
jgi:hypothetical protein